MGQIEDLVERFKAQDALFKDFEIDNIVKAIIEHTNNCDSLPTGDKIKALSFLYNKCDYILNSIASSMNYELEYEPSDDEIWRFVEQEKKHIDPNCDDLSYYDNFIADDSGYLDESGLYEIVIEPMRKKYKEKYKEASEWCDKIQDIQTDIYIKISKEKEKQVFLNEVFKSKGEVVKTFFDEYITPICPNKELLKIKLKQILHGEKGRNIAISLTALDKLKYINLEKIEVKKTFAILQSEFGVIGSRSALDTALTKIKNNKNDSKYIMAVNKDMEILRQ